MSCGPTPTRNKMMSLHDTSNVPLTLIRVSELMGLLAMLSRPDGLADLLARISAAHEEAVGAYQRLAEQQERAKATIADATARATEATRQAAEIERQRTALDADRQAHETAVADHQRA